MKVAKGLKIFVSNFDYRFVFEKICDSVIQYLLFDNADMWQCENCLVR